MARRTTLIIAMMSLFLSCFAQELQKKPSNKILDEIRKAHTDDEREKLLLDLLAAHDAEIKISKGANNTTIFIETIAILVLLIVLLYDRYRIRKRTQKLVEFQLNEIETKNRSLANLARDKEWLIREIHHRIKNNLQMMISLLNVQSEYLNNPTAVTAIRESKERIETIAIIHKKLNQTEVHFSKINMQSYIHELVDAIKDCFAENKNIYFNFDVDPIDLDISEAVPVGLILNETITNAVKHAYNTDESGSITVALKFTGVNQFELKVADHGKGLPDNLEAANSNTLGFQLIKLFCEQLDGKIFFTNNKGLEVIITFKNTEYNEIKPVKIPE